MHLPAGTVFDELNNPRVLQPALQRKGRNEVIFTRHEAGEAYPRHEDEPSLLRNHLDVSERLYQCDVSPREREHRGLRSGEERLQREPTARVPLIPGDEARAALRTRPYRPELLRTHRFTVRRMNSPPKPVRCIPR